MKKISPSSSRREEVLDDPDRRAVEERVAAHQDACRAPRARRRSSLASSPDGASGFSTKVCLPASSAREARSKCVKTGRGDQDRVELRVVEQEIHVGGPGGAGIAVLEAPQAAARRGRRSTSRGPRASRTGPSAGWAPSTRGQRSPCSGCATACWVPLEELITGSPRRRPAWPRPPARPPPA